MRTLTALPSKQGRKPKHAWDLLFDGNVNVAGYTPANPDPREGEFDCTVDSFISQARNAAKSRGLSLTAIKVTPDNGGRVGQDGTVEDGTEVEVLLDVAIQAEPAEADEAEGTDEEE